MMTNAEMFVEVYTEELAKAMTADPGSYLESVSAAPKIAKRMTQAFIAKCANKDGPAVRSACRRLGIPYTYKAIEAYLKGEK